MIYLLFFLMIALNKNIMNHYFTKKNNSSNLIKIPNINPSKFLIIPYELEPHEIFHFFTILNI